MEKNDWIVAGLNNPDFTNSDFTNIADMTLQNTQLLKPAEYLKSDFIKTNPAFKDENGSFSEDKFKDYYKKRVQDFGVFQQEEASQGPALDMFDIDRTPKSKIQDIHFDIKRGVNPDRQAIGIEGVNIWSDPIFSRREIAKQNKVFNTETGQFENYTVNEHTLVTSPIEWLKDQFKDPLVLATYDEDGVHIDPITGVERTHKKGEAKLNNKGTYYYETLGGRSVIGKEVLSLFDTFTVDGQGINKYDFFDSNDIKKSTSGVIAKNVVAILPLFLGPVVGGIYSAALMGRELSKALPMMYGMATALTDSETPTWVNTLAAYGAKASSSTSDYARSNAFSFENFGNLTSDVALQWGQQKAIASIFGKLKGAPNYVEEAHKNAKALYDAKKVALGESEELWKACLNKFLPAAEKKAVEATALGRNASLAYMAIISNTDVYSDMLSHGATKKEAAAVALGSTLGMFAFDKYSKLGELFFDDATGDYTRSARRALRNEFRQAQEVFSGISSAEAPAKNKFMGLISAAAETSKRVFNRFNEDLKYHTLNAAEKIIGEGLEEVGEELIMDTSKSLYELAGELGFNTSVKDVGAWDNAFDRYAMSFLGGAVGGAVFHGKTILDQGGFRKPRLDEDIATLIRNGHVDELRSQLAEMTKEGKAGNKNLSATDYDVTDDNQVVWRTTENESESQSQAVADLVNDRINSIEEILIGNQANLSDDELFDNMVLTEKRYNRYKSISQLTNYYQDFATVLNNLVNDELAFRHAGETMEGTPDGTKVPNDTALIHLTDQQKQQRQANLDALNNKLTQSRESVKNFLAGENSLDYTRKLNFAMDSALHSPFLEVDMDSYLQTLHPGKTLQDLTPEEALKFMTQQWPEYVQTQLKTKLTSAWEKFKQFEASINPHLDTLSQNVPAYKNWVENITNLFGSGVLNTENLRNSYKTIDSKLDTETDDEFNNRNKKIIDPLTGVEETDEAFNLRKFKRFQAIKAYNDSMDAKWAADVEAELQKVNYEVDPQTARYLRRLIPVNGRLRSVIDRTISFGTLSPKVKSILKGLDTDLSNTQEISDTIKQTMFTQMKGKVNDLIKALEFFELEDSSGNTSDLLTYVESDPNLETLTIEEALQDLIDYENDPINNPTLFVDLEDSNRIKFKEALQNIVDTNIQGIEQVELKDVAEGMIEADMFKDEIEQESDILFKPIQNSINTVVADISNNALFKLQKKLNTKIVNPVGELLKSIAASNNDSLPDIDNILETIQNDYDGISDVHQLQLNDTQRNEIEKARDYMKLLKVYLQAASTLPSTNAPIGHNRTINMFAEEHKDKLRSQWQKLPEIDADYATLYLQNLDGYIDEIDNWISFSDQNSINKISKFTRTGKVLSNVLWETLAKLPRSFSYNGKTLDILEGIDSIDKTMLDSNLAQVPLYNLERLIYKNINQFAADNGISVSELIQNSNLLEALIPGIQQLNNQRSSKVTDTLEVDGFTDFDKLQYLASIISDDPANFYQALFQRVNTNNQIAPVTTQELSARIAQSSMHQTFRDILAKAHSLSSLQETPLLSNTTIIFGVAGAGKTQVVLNSIDSAIKGEEVFIAGPTLKQAEAMRNAMGRNSAMTFNELLITLLGKDQLDRIKVEFDSYDNPGDFDGTFFSTITGQDGLLKLTLKLNNIQFNQLAQAPKAIYIDEATHLNTLEARIIDAYAASVGAQVFMCGDPAQLGYNNAINGIQNIDEGAVFASRTPPLTISLRDNNLQKFQNQEAVRTLLSEVLEKRLYDSQTDYEAFFATVQNLLPKFKFKAYTGSELNGDLIVPSLNDNTIAQLKAGIDSGKTIAFVGQNTSAHLDKLRAAGIDIPPEHVLNLATMQGQEFDYVVIDENFDVPTNIVEARSFLQQLYTLMTRAREASVFIDNGLSSIIGRNIQSPNKSKAPSIKSGIAQLISDKLDILKQLDFTPINITGNVAVANANSVSANATTNSATVAATPNSTPVTTSTPVTSNTPTSSTQTVASTPVSSNVSTPASTPVSSTANTGNTSTPVSTSTTSTSSSTTSSSVVSQTPSTSVSTSVTSNIPTGIVTEEDFKDPDNRTNGEESIKAVEEMLTTDTSGTGLVVPYIDVNGQSLLDSFPIECYGDVTFLSIDTIENVEVQGKNGKKYKSSQWVVPAVSGNAELRNLQALLTDSERNAGKAEAFWYKDKIALQRRLYEVKSAILFKHSWPTAVDPKSMPAVITRNFNQKDWENGVYELEFRTPTSQDITPIHGSFNQAGFDYKGQRIIANIVFKVKDKRGRICKFDLAGINSPKTLIDNKLNIKNSLSASINNPKIDDATKTRLQKMIDGIDSVSLVYQNWFEEKLKEFNKNGSLSIDVSSAITHSETTWFKPRKGKPIRLGGTINPDNVNEHNVQSLIHQNPDKVFSSVYTFTSNEADFYNLDSSIKGKAVIFVSDDVLLDPSELLPTYLSQKRNPDSNTPKVRMLMLDNYGMSFSQLNDSEYIKAFQEGKEDRKPFRQNFTGIRMFTSMWNTRASLIKFTKALNDFKSQNNFTDAQLNILSQAQYMVYQQESPDKIETLLKGAGLKIDHLQLLDEFNNETCKDIPMFRLGYSFNENGFHIQQFNVKDSIAYDNLNAANLCVISPEKANQFLGMLQAVMQPICPSNHTSTYAKQNSLNLRLTKIAADGSEIDWAEDEFIDLEQANHRRTLSGLLQKEGNTLKIETTDKDGNIQTLAYANGEHWSIIPSLVSKLVRTVTRFQHEPSLVANKNSVFARLTYPVNNGHTTIDATASLEVDINSFFGNQGFLKPTTPEGKIDHSFFDMFNLMFHGTTDDIHRPVGDGKTVYTNPDGTTEVRQPLMQLTDAYFKQGFFINPDISRRSNGADATDIVGHRGNNNKLIFFEIGTNPALFTVDVDLRSSGLRLNLQELINPSNPKPASNTITSSNNSNNSTTNTAITAPTTPTTTTANTAPTTISPEEEFKQKFPQFVPIIDLLIQAGRIDSDGNPFTYSEDSIDEAIEVYNDINQDSIKTLLKVGKLEAALKAPYQVQRDGQILTYEIMLLSKYPGATFDTSNQSIRFTDAQGTVYEITTDLENPTVISQAAISTTNIEESQPTVTSLFDEKFEGSTVGNVLMALLNNPSFKESLEDMQLTDDNLPAFMQEIQTAIDLGKTLTDDIQPLKDKLEQILNNEDYEDLIGALYEINEDLYNKLFNNEC